MASFTLVCNKNTGYGLDNMREARVETLGGIGGVGQTGFAFFGFDLSALEGHKLTAINNFTFSVYDYTGPGNADIVVYPCTAAWKDEEWNWKDIPKDDESITGAADLTWFSPGLKTLTNFNAEKIQNIVRYGLAIGAWPDSDIDGLYRAQIYTQMNAGGYYAPKINAEFSAVPLTLFGLYPNKGAAYLAGETVPLAWWSEASEAEGGAVFGTARASHYQVLYKGPADPGYRLASLGNENHYDLDTSVFTAGDTIKWYVEATATNGAVSRSEEQTISLKPPSITIDDLYPSGSSDIYAGLGFTASWRATFTVPSGTIGSSYQASAVVRVRKRGTVDVREYRVSGSRQSIALPAVGEGSWEWQVEVTDNHGATKTSNWTGFTAKALAINATDLYPKETNRAPSKVDNKFSWNIHIATDPEYQGIQQQSAVLRWRETGKTALNEIRLGAVTEYTIPAGKLPAKSSIDWQVTIVANTGIESTTDWITVPTSDALSQPEPVFPVGRRVTEEDGITFTWNNRIVTNTPQQAWELSTSEDAGATWTVQGSGDNADTAFALPTGVLTQPSVQWRVRTKNTDGDWGTSAPATFILLRAAKTPSISYTDSRPLTILAWQSDEQEAYRVRIDDYDTGWVISTQGRYFHPYILADGPHAVRVQIMNATGSASAEAAITIHTENVPGAAPALSILERNGYVALAWPAVEGAAYVVRDGTAIARPQGQSYIDHKTVGAHQYVLRVVQDRYYTDSPPLVGITQVRYALLTPLARMDFVELALRRGGAPGHSKNLAGQVEYRHYYGRAKPVKYTAGFVDTGHGLGFTLADPADIAKLEAWVTEDVIYKDCFGRLAVGGLDGVDEALDQRADLDFTLTEMDYKELVPYAED